MTETLAVSLINITSRFKLQVFAVDAAVYVNAVGSVGYFDIAAVIGDGSVNVDIGRPSLVGRDIRTDRDRRIGGGFFGNSHFERAQIGSNRGAFKFDRPAVAFGNNDIGNTHKSRTVVFDRHRSVAGHRQSSAAEHLLRIEINRARLGINIIKGNIINGGVHNAAVFAVKSEQSQFCLQSGNFLVIISFGFLIVNIVCPQFFKADNFLCNRTVKLFCAFLVIKPVIVVKTVVTDGYLYPAVTLNHIRLNIVYPGLGDAVDFNPRIVIDAAVENFVFQRQQLIIGILRFR